MTRLRHNFEMIRVAPLLRRPTPNRGRARNDGRGLPVLQQPWLLVAALSALLAVAGIFAAVQLGTGAPAVHAATQVQQVEVGSGHACALDRSGKITCWGDDSRGQVSDWGDYGYRSKTFDSVSAGSFFTCGILTNGSVECWGYPETQGGTNHESDNKNWADWLALSDTDRAAYTGWVNTPPDTLKFKPESLSVGNYHACAIQTNGQLACWGKAGDQRLIIPKDGSNTITDWIMVEAGWAHACAIRERDTTVTGGSVHCFGRTSHNRSQGPTGQSATSSFIDVTLGLYNGCALAADGTMACWGGHSYYDTYVDPNDPDQRPVNTQVNTAPAGVTFASIEMGTGRSLRLRPRPGRSGPLLGLEICVPGPDERQRGLVRAALSRRQRQLRGAHRRLPPVLGRWRLRPLQATQREFQAGGRRRGLRMRHQVRRHHRLLGRRQLQQAARQAPTTGTFKAVASGSNHSCAIKSDDTVACWGGVNPHGLNNARQGRRALPEVLRAGRRPGPDLRRHRGYRCHRRDAALLGRDHPQPPDRADRHVHPRRRGRHPRLRHQDGQEHGVLGRSGILRPGWRQHAGRHRRQGQPHHDHPAVRYAPVHRHHRRSRNTPAPFANDKKAVCWGYHADGRNAVPGYGSDAQGFGNRNYEDIATGGFNNCAILETSGKLDCWNDEYPQYQPGADVLALTGFTSLGAGSRHMCGTRGSGTLVCWGVRNMIDFPRQFARPPASPIPHPRPISAVVDGDRLTITFDRSLGQSFTPDLSIFTLSGIAGDPRVVGVVIDGRRVTLTLSAPARWDDTVLVSYRRAGDSALVGSNHRNVRSFTLSATNETPRSSTVASVALASDPGEDLTYGVGDAIRVEVTFSEEVSVTGAPRLKLDLFAAAPEREPSGTELECDVAAAFTSERWMNYAGRDAATLAFHLHRSGRGHNRRCGGPVQRARTEWRRDTVRSIRDASPSGLRRSARRHQPPGRCSPCRRAAIPGALIASDGRGLRHGHVDLAFVRPRRYGLGQVGQDQRNRRQVD